MVGIHSYRALSTILGTVVIVATMVACREAADRKLLGDLGVEELR